MNKKINKMWMLALLLPLLAIVGCSPIDEYKDFVKGGEILYTGKVDSIHVLTGKGRIIITGLFMSDPKVTSCRIYWDSKRDSMDIPVTKTAGIDTLWVSIPLAEKTYDFEIYTYDAAGNRSVVVNAYGRSYGALYQGSLLNKEASKAVIMETGPATINWLQVDKTLGAVASELTYLSTDGTTKKLRVPATDKQTIIPDLDPIDSLRYFTLYSPDTTCVDTFVTKTSAIKVKVVAKLSKAAWTITTDSEETQREGANGFATCAIDDNKDTFWHTKHPGNGDTPFPHWLLIDLHQTVTVASFDTTPRQNNDQGITNFEILGSLDGITWISYGVFEQNAQTNATQSFTVTKSTPMRYFKFYATNGRNGSYTHIGEITIFESR